MSDHTAEARGGFFGLAAFGQAVYFGRIAVAGARFSSAVRSMMTTTNDPDLEMMIEHVIQTAKAWGSSFETPAMMRAMGKKA